MTIKQVGVVASGATRSGMTFFSKESPCTDYVFVRTKRRCRIVYEVVREVAQNTHLTEPDMVRFLEQGDDLTSYNVYISEAVPVACIDEKGHTFQDPYAIAAPGSPVYKAAADSLAKVYDVGLGENREKVGYLLHRSDVPIYLDLDDLLCAQAHMAVVGRTGCGKSWFTTRYLERLRMKCVIFSQTDEYDRLATPHTTLRREDIALPLDPDLTKRMFDLTSSERKFLKDFLQRSDINEETYAPDELSAKMEHFFRKTSQVRSPQYGLFADYSEEFVSLPQYAASLCRKLEESGLQFRKKSFQKSEHERTTVYNLQGCRRAEEERIIYSTLFPILEKRKARFKSTDQAVPLEDHLVIALEEAQNYAPSNRSTLCKDLLVDIARTGRKYGLHILLLSQRPRFIDQTILSQCGCGLFFHLPNPEDVEYVMSAAALNRSAAFKHMIQNFDTGQCILVRAAKSSLDLACRISF